MMIHHSGCPLQPPHHRSIAWLSAVRGCKAVLERRPHGAEQREVQLGSALDGGPMPDYVLKRIGEIDVSHEHEVIVGKPERK